MSLGTHIKNYNLYVDGTSYAGEVEEVNLPKITLKNEEYRAGGMDAPITIDMGMEKLEADFQISGMKSEIYRLLSTSKAFNITLRAAVSDETGDITPHIAVLRGKVRAIEPATVKTGEKGNLKVMLDVTYYAHTIGAEQILEIDVPNMVRKFADNDVLKLVRQAIGL